VNGYPSRASALEGGLIEGLRKTVIAAQPSADVESVRRAFDVAAYWHQGQTRRSGDPYITHPVSVATILAGLGADDQTVCAAILHDTVEDTPYTLTALCRDFGAGIAALVAEHKALDQISGVRERKAAQALTAITSADSRVVALKMADRLHNMRTLQFMPQETQLRKAREVLDFFGPAARQLSMGTVGPELETLAFAALRRARPVRPSCYRTIIALDIEDSTSRPDQVKAELRTMLYELFDVALRSAGIYPRHRDRFIDRGDGLLALIRPVDQAPKALLLNRVIPEFSRLLSAYNTSLPPQSSPQRQVRVRVVLHAGEVHYDPDGCYGEALDIAFRLLDAPVVKKTFRTAPDPLILVVSGDIYSSVVRHGYDQIDGGPFHRLITQQIADNQYTGWIQISGQATEQPGARFHSVTRDLAALRRLARGRPPAPFSWRQAVRSPWSGRRLASRAGPACRPSPR
jgi:HD domain